MVEANVRVINNVRVVAARITNAACTTGENETISLLFIRFAQGHQSIELDFRSIERSHHEGLTSLGGYAGMLVNFIL